MARLVPGCDNGSAATPDDGEGHTMGGLLKRLVVLGVIVGLGLQVLKRLGLFTGGECGPNCDCSMGAEACTCGHPTCLTPAMG